MLNNRQKLQQIIDLNLEIAQIQDIDVLLEKILSAARKLINADAGCIYIKAGKDLHCRCIQNDAIQTQFAPGKELTGTTSAVPVNHTSIPGYVASTGEIVNIPDIARWPAGVPYGFKSCSAETFSDRAQSLLAIPLKYYRDDPIGVIYLVNARNDMGEVIAFSDDDLPILKIFANYVAIPIEWAQTVRVRIQGMIRLLTELQDPEETEGHVNRVGAYSAEIYKVWAYKKGLSPAKIDAVTEQFK